MKRFLPLLLFLCALTHAHAALPAVWLKDIDGNNVNTAGLTGDGKPLIISFWATWCKPCIRELKAIHELYPDWQDETGVRIIIVSIDAAQDEHKVRPLVDGFGWDFDVLLDPNGDFKRAINVQAVPHIFIIDRNGRIVHNHSGYTDGAENDIYQILKTL